MSRQALAREPSPHASALLFACRLLLRRAAASSPKLAAIRRSGTIWLVGAREEVEGSQASSGGFEVLAKLEDLGFRPPIHILLIGPEMSCTKIAYFSGEVSVSSVASCLEDMPTTFGSSPACALCFNSGLGTKMLPVAGPWLEALPPLLGLGVPVCFVSPSLLEARGERGILVHRIGARALTQIRRCRAGTHSGSGAVAGHANAFVWWCSAGGDRRAEAALPAVWSYLRSCTRAATRCHASAWRQRQSLRKCPQDRLPFSQQLPMWRRRREWLWR